MNYDSFYFGRKYYFQREQREFHALRKMRIAGRRYHFLPWKRRCGEACAQHQVVFLAAAELQLERQRRIRLQPQRHHQIRRRRPIVDAHAELRVRQAIDHDLADLGTDQIILPRPGDRLGHPPHHADVPGVLLRQIARIRACSCLVLQFHHAIHHADGAVEGPALPERLGLFPAHPQRRIPPTAAVGRGEVGEHSLLAARRIDIDQPALIIDPHQHLLRHVTCQRIVCLAIQCGTGAHLNRKGPTGARLADVQLFPSCRGKRSPASRGPPRRAAMNINLQPACILLL